MTLSDLGLQPATLIACGGWVVTGAGWWISQRHQGRLFRQQVKNTARSEIVTALRRRQDVSMALSRIVLRVKLEGVHAQGLNWAAVVQDYRRAMEGDDARWIMLLEEYEVVFPKAARCRRALVGRSLALTEEIGTFFAGLRDDDYRSRVLPQAGTLIDQLADENGLLEDLLIYVQNETLGSVFGRTAPVRCPTDDRAPRIVIGTDGHLEIRRGERDNP